MPINPVDFLKSLITEKGLFEPYSKSHISEDNTKPTEPLKPKTQVQVKKLITQPLALFSITVLSFLILLSILVPIFSTYTYCETHLPLKNFAPCLKFWFGTDELGRDILTRVSYGIRISLLVGVAAALIDTIIGIIYGAIAGSLGGKIEELMMRFADILSSLPSLLLVIPITMVLGNNLGSLIAALALTGWVSMARMVRAQTLLIKKQEFVEAAIVMGASLPRLIFIHFIPNMLGPIIVTLTFSIPSAILYEAFLSFLGLGVQAPAASLGTMASDAIVAMRYYPWRIFFPALTISLIILSFNLLGDALCKIFDPKDV